MTITVNAQGKKFNFPDGTTNAQISESVDSFFQSSGGAQDGNIPDSGLGVPSGSGVAQQPGRQEVDKGFLSSAGEFFTGSERETRATKELPEFGQGGLLFGEDKVIGAAITPALLTVTDPNEMAKILTENVPNIGITSDEKGNLIANNNKTGVRVVLNQPGVSRLDVLQGLGIAAAFTPAGRLAGAVKVGAGAGATSAGIEGLQALSGGEFDTSQVVIDTLTAGLLDKAITIAKATGATIKDVFRNNLKIDPDKLLQSFERGESGVTFSSFGTKTKPEVRAIQEQGGAIQQIQRASAPDLTPQAIDRIRQAERQGVQLTRAQSVADFGGAEAEQTLLKSISKEGDQARAFVEQQQEQLKTAAESFTEKFGGSARFKEALGESVEDTARGKGELIQDVLTETQELGRKEVSDLYTAAGETAGDAIPLNNSSIVDIADEVIVNRPITKEVEKSINTALAKFGLIGDSVEQLSRNKFKVLDGDESITIIGDVTPLSLNNAEEFRKALNKAVGADQTGSAKLVVRSLDDQVKTIIEEGAESGRTTAFKAARGAARAQKETFKAKDVIEDLTSLKRGTSTPKVDPETVINKIAKGDKSVTNIRKIKRILLTSPTEQSRKAWKAIQGETVGDILGQAINKDTLEISGARLNSALKKYKPEALRELLGKSQFSELMRLKETIGTATIPPPGTTNPSGTFTKLLAFSERLGNFAGAGQVNFGSLLVAGVQKGKELKGRKKVLSDIINTKIKKLAQENPKMKNSQVLKAAKVLAFLEIRELDKDNKR